MVETKSKSPRKDSKKSKSLATVNDKDVVATIEATATPNLASSSKTKQQKGSNTMSDMPSVIEFSEDISEAEAPVPLPVGDYPAEIRKAERKESQTSGNAYAAITFYVSPDNYPADYVEGDPDGENLVFRGVSLEDTPRSRHRMKKFLSAIGANMGTKIDLNDWIGLSGTITVVHEAYEGEDRAVIKAVNPA